MDWDFEFDKKLDANFKYLQNKFDELSRQYDKMIDALKSLKAHGNYILRVVYDDGKSVVYTFGSIYDAFSEMRSCIYIGKFKLVLKYEVKR